jgi:PAS domain-containing protein
VSGNRNLAPTPHYQVESVVPTELNVALTLRDERMKRGGSVRADYTAVVDGARRYVEVSDSFCQLVGYRREELIGKRYDDLTAPGTNDITAVFRLFVSRSGATILVRFESWVRSDCYIQGNMELVKW